MKKEKNAFISNPIMIVTFAVFAGLASCLLIVMLVFGFNQIIESPALILVIIILLSLVFFFLLLIKKFTYRICFEGNFLIQYKVKKLMNKFNLADIKMIFISPKYGFVNIEGTNIEGIKVVLCFEYSKKRGEIVSKYFKKDIENLPERLK